MTNLITLTIPNDDTIALRQFGKALIEIASEKDGRPVDVTVTPLVISTETLQQAAPQMMNAPEVDSTAQQVESLSNKREEFEQIVDDVKVAVSEFLNVPSHVLTGQEAPPTIDSTGTPWDERIHSASKALNADGTWRLRRKPKDMDEVEWSDYVSMIKADLQYPVECGGEGEEIGEPTREEVDELIEASNKMLEPHVTPPGDDFHTDADVVSEQTVAGIPPLPVPPPVVVAPPVPEVTEWDFPRLMTFLTERHGKIDVATVNTLLAQDGMSSVQELNAHPDKIGPFVARVKAHLGE
ncbi:hypothetical protein KB2_gp019 [Klebsiella phage vB_KleM_KB2]|uniref:Uncharacterized protein n=1 Tax=Klebsiella phage vB_KleM_KB2 TaxID=2759197 RepID=A0AAE7J024_9CAUD|nr:hypothetical protein PQZ66_gp24 [Klebsiella phage vB_KleM_KB2]QNI20501.1 hypothetical protein KB2_gp019 [Klebsiella phage vB_KleM_KB2]